MQKGRMGVLKLTGLFAIVGTAFVISTSVAGAADSFDVPTGAAPSPLFGALPFTQEVLQLLDLY